MSNVSWSPLSIPEAEALAIVATGLYRLAPPAVVEVPADGRADAFLEPVPRRPLELAADFRRVDGVAAIVPGPVRYERLEVAVVRPAGQRGVGVSGPQRLQLVADAVDDFNVGP